MKIVTVSPSNYDENYAFPVGNHRVTWMGTSDSGTQISCSFHVTVNGEILLLSYELVLKDVYGRMSDQRRVFPFLLMKQDNLVSKKYFITWDFLNTCTSRFPWQCYFIRIGLHLVKHLMIKISEISLTQRFDDSMSSFCKHTFLRSFSSMFLFISRSVNW